MSFVAPAVPSSFEDWVSGCAGESKVAKHREQLQKVDASWSNFEQESSREEFLAAAVDAGIPRLASNAIFTEAFQALAAQNARREAPLCVFWDMENISSNSYGYAPADTINAIIKNTARFGKLKNIRSYSSLVAVNEVTRSVFQQRGYPIIDTPHLGKKEAADKMLLVDVMEFIVEHRECATVVLITNDNDFGYLLARLRERAGILTVLVSSGSLQRVMHSNAHVVMQWQTSVLQLGRSAHAQALDSIVTPCRPRADRVAAAPATAAAVAGASSPRSAAAAAAAVSSPTSAASASRPSLEHDDGDDDDSEVRTVTDDAENDKIDLLCDTLVELERNAPSGVVARSTLVNRLREIQNGLFPSNAAAGQCLSTAVERGFVAQRSDNTVHVDNGVSTDSGLAGITLSVEDETPSQFYTQLPWLRRLQIVAQSDYVLLCTHTNTWSREAKGSAGNGTAFYASDEGSIAASSSRHALMLLVRKGSAPPSAYTLFHPDRASSLPLDRIVQVHHPDKDKNSKTAVLLSELSETHALGFLEKSDGVVRWCEKPGDVCKRRWRCPFVHHKEAATHKLKLQQCIDIVVAATAITQGSSDLTGNDVRNLDDLAALVKIARSIAPSGTLMRRSLLGTEVKTIAKFDFKATLNRALAEGLFTAGQVLNSPGTAWVALVATE